MLADLPLTLRYALAASVCLARHGTDRSTSKAVAEETGIPPAFLAKVLAQLRKSGLVEGTKGHHGGYRLARPAEEIYLADVVAAVDADDAGDLARVCAMGNRPCDKTNPCALHDLWLIATAPVLQISESVTLARLARMSGQDV